MEEFTVPERGDVYRVSLHGAGHQVAGPHYAVVVSDGPYNELSTVIVVPFSSGARPAAFRPEGWLAGRRTRALVEQVTAVDRRFLRDRIESLSGTALMAEIDDQLKQVLSLDY